MKYTTEEIKAALRSSDPAYDEASDTITYTIEIDGIVLSRTISDADFMDGYTPDDDTMIPDFGNQCVSFEQDGNDVFEDMALSMTEEANETPAAEAAQDAAEEEKTAAIKTLLSTNDNGLQDLHAVLGLDFCAPLNAWTKGRIHGLKQGNVLCRNVFQPNLNGFQSLL